MIALLTACSFTRAFGNTRKSLRRLTSNSEKLHSGFTGNGTTLISKPIVLKWEPNFSTKITSSASTRLLIWKFPTYFPHEVHRSLHTTPGSQQNKNENQENQNNNDGVFVMTLFIITLVFILSVYQALGLDAFLGMTEHISWSHFVEKYLVSGEVVQISMISRHSAMVHLQRDAVFDGKRVNFLVIDNLKNPASLEEMLRREESRLNVNPLDAIPINSLQPSTGRSMLTTFFWTSVLLIGGLALFMKNSPGP
uniref:Peptidase M41 FtsH extracellular domain-containing protein n=1 Tax=Ciona savignyi TaxID=51511 RepID=H2Y537_CIOSA